MAMLHTAMCMERGGGVLTITVYNLVHAYKHWGHEQGIKPSVLLLHRTIMVTMVMEEEV